MKKQLRVLLGAVPFGENNVGDEAILETVISIVRTVCPDADIIVSTSEGAATARKFDVRTVPLFGFGEKFRPADMQEALEGVDVFIWSGATGLSDYPENATGVLNTAREAGAKTVLWGVGMNDELNPAKYTVLPGKRRTVLKIANKLAVGTVDTIARREDNISAHARECVRKALTAADLIVMRDFPSREQVQKCGVTREIKVGADSAILMKADPLEKVMLRDGVRELINSDKKKVAVCISAQREVTNRFGLVRYLDRVVADDSTRILFIPMNPLTDSALMADLRRDMQFADRTEVMNGYFEPSEVTAVVGQMDLAIASRLHLLILASISHVPIIGIARGSKVDNFVAPYGLVPAGSVEDCDFDALWSETQRLLGGKEAFQEKSRQVHADLKRRLEGGMEDLRAVFESV